MAITEGLRRLTAVEKRIKRRQTIQQRMQRLGIIFGGRTPKPRRKVA
ncbi:MAG: hypothetical protein WC634_00385 [archaeon]